MVLGAAQMHPRACIVCDEDATLDLKVRTVKYFKSLLNVHNKMLGMSRSFGFFHGGLAVIGCV